MTLTEKLTVCPACLRTVAADDGTTYRLATAGDTTNLSPLALDKLRNLRKQLRRAL